MAAASTTVRTLLLGPARPLRVVATTPRALYLAAADAVDAGALSGAGPVVALLAPDAVRVPFGVVLDNAVLPALAAVRVGDPAAAGDGALRLAGMAVRPQRWWDPGVPPLHVVAGRVAAALDRLLPGAPEEIADRVPALAEALCGSAGSADRVALAARVRELLGRGPGLTPAGDDVLAGALCALTAVRPDPPVRAPLARAVLAEVHRTTPVSAALLGEAAAGRAVPQVVDVLRALGRADGEQHLPAAVDGLLAVGHTSGAALGHGLVLGLRAAAAARLAA